MTEKCQMSSSVFASLWFNTGSGTSLSEKATRSGRLCERKDDGIRLGQTWICHNGIRPLTSPAMIHGSMVTEGEVIPTFDGTDF